jgi:hypothetical protein
MMRRFFGDSRERLLLSVLGDDEIDPEELARLKQAIAEASDRASSTSKNSRAKTAVSREEEAAQ